MAAARLKTIGYTNNAIHSIPPYDPFNGKTNSDMVHHYKVICRYIRVRTERASSKLLTKHFIPGTLSALTRPPNGFRFRNRSGRNRNKCTVTYNHTSPHNHTSI